MRADQLFDCQCRHERHALDHGKIGASKRYGRAQRYTGEKRNCADGKAKRTTKNTRKTQNAGAYVRYEATRRTCSDIPIK